MTVIITNKNNHKVARYKRDQFSYEQWARLLKSYKPNSHFQVREYWFDSNQVYQTGPKINLFNYLVQLRIKEQ